MGWPWGGSCEPQGPQQKGTAPIHHSSKPPCTLAMPLFSPKQHFDTKALPHPNLSAPPSPGGHCPQMPLWAPLEEMAQPAVAVLSLCSVTLQLPPLQEHAAPPACGMRRWRALCGLLRALGRSGGSWWHSGQDSTASTCGATAAPCATSRMPRLLAQPLHAYDMLQLDGFEPCPWQGREHAVSKVT